MKGSLLIPAILCLAALLAGCHKKPAVRDDGSTGKEETSAAPTASATPAARSAETKAAPSAQGEDHPGVAAAAAQLGATTAEYEAWFRKYHLDLNDPKMLDEDPDGDGYTNREEFLANTDPLDPNSHPNTNTHAGVHEGLVMKTFNEVKVPLMLKSVDGDSAKIERMDEGAGKIEDVRPGQTLRNTQYKVEKVQSHRGMDKEGNAVDSSHVTLRDPTTKEELTLVKDLQARSPATTAILEAKDGSGSVTVHLGETFTWPAKNGVSYKVTDISSGEAVLQETGTGRIWTVLKR